MSMISRLGMWPQRAGENTALVVAGTAVATAALLSLLHRYLWPTPPRLVRSPLRTVLPRLSRDELDRLEYRPDNFPGARDVETPYGSIRVYEWGPLAGEKVLLVHGISTACITLTKLAEALVAEKGCRVMLFDLFGRGFSDNPADLPHDARLYTTQILLALASSPDAAWTGPRAFRLVGYSLGGGIAVSFAAAFPHLISSLVLLAPAGLIRPESFGLLARAVFASGLVPPRLLAWITRRRLRRPIRSGGKKGGRRAANASRTEGAETGNRAGTDTTTAKPDPVAASLSEATTITATADAQGAEDAEAGEPRNALEQRVLRQVHWQLSHHAGFVPAFMSCIRHAPLTGQHAAWRRLADRPAGTTAIVLGEGDEIIDPDELRADAAAVMGAPLSSNPGTRQEPGKEQQLKWAVVPGGHDFPMTYARETLREIYKAWGWE